VPLSDAKLERPHKEGNENRNIHIKSLKLTAIRDEDAANTDNRTHNSAFKLKKQSLCDLILFYSNNTREIIHR
jgi:hypothetical protein